MTHYFQMKRLGVLCLALVGLGCGTARADARRLVATMVSPDVSFEQRVAARQSLRNQPSDEVLAALVKPLWQTVPTGMEAQITQIQEPEETQTPAVQAFKAVRSVWYEHSRATKPVPEVGRLLLAQLNERRAHAVVTLAFTMSLDKLWVPEAGEAFTKLALAPSSEHGVRREAARLVLNRLGESGFITARKAFYLLPEDAYQSQLEKANLISEIFTVAAAHPNYAFLDKEKFVQHAFRFIEVTGQKQPSTMYPLIRSLGPMVGQKFVPDGRPDFTAVRDGALTWWARNRF